VFSAHDFIQILLTYDIHGSLDLKGAETAPIGSERVKAVDQHCKVIGFNESSLNQKYLKLI
jgi:hypothetical protein